MNNKPNKWVATILSLVVTPLGMLYVAQLVWAAIYFIGAIVLAVVSYFYLRQVPIVANVLIFGFSVVCAVHTYRLSELYPVERVRPHYSRWYALLGVTVGLFSLLFGFRAFLFEPFRFPSGSMIPTINPGSYFIAKKWGYGHYGTYGFIPFPRPITAELRRGDLLVFDYPENRSVQYVKRLIALPGDKVAYLDKKLSINGNAVPQVEIDKFFDGAIHESVLKMEETIEGNRYVVLRNQDAGINTSVLSKHVSSFRFMENCKYDVHGVVCDVPAGHYYFMGDNRDNSKDSRYWGFVPADHIVGKVIHIF